MKIQQICHGRYKYYIYIYWCQHARMWNYLKPPNNYLVNQINSFNNRMHQYICKVYMSCATSTLIFCSEILCKLTTVITQIRGYSLYLSEWPIQFICSCHEKWLPHSYAASLYELNEVWFKMIQQWSVARLLPSKNYTGQKWSKDYVRKELKIHWM